MAFLASRSELRLCEVPSTRELEELLAIERDVFPENERFGFGFEAHVRNRLNGLILAEAAAGASAEAAAEASAEASAEAATLTAAAETTSRHVGQGSHAQTIAGYCIFGRVAAAGVITKIAVAAPFRRRGLGTALLQRGIAELARGGCSRHAVEEIMLHVDPERGSARKLYESLGFRAHERLTAYYGLGRDAILMRLQLGSAPQPTEPPILTTSEGGSHSGREG